MTPGTLAGPGRPTIADIATAGPLSGRGAVRRRLARTTRRRHGATAPDRRRAVAALIGVATALILGGWLGALAGIAAAVLSGRLLRCLQLPAGLLELRRASDELPLALDLLAATLRSGAPPDHAAAAVAEAVGGPLGDRLAHVARALRLGADAAEAWRHLGRLPGADRLSRAAVRSSSSGAATAAAVGRLADDLRAERVVAAEAAARRAGVLLVLPLGFCFLPAFVLAGLVPVIVAIFGDVQ